MQNDEDRSVPARERKSVLVAWEITFILESWGDIPGLPNEVLATTFRVNVPSEEARSRDDAIAVAAIEYMLPLVKRLGVDQRTIQVTGVRTLRWTPITEDAP